MSADSGKLLLTQPAATRGGFVLLRCPGREWLCRAVADCAWSLSSPQRPVVDIPAGPYRFPYAAARELALRLNGVARGFPAPGEDLNRALAAKALRPLASGRCIVAIPALDRIDVESIHLLNDLVRISVEAGLAGMDAGVTLVAGAPVGPALNRLGGMFDASLVTVAEVDAAGVPSTSVLSSMERRIAALLSAAPHPLELERLRSLCSAGSSQFNSALSKLESADAVVLRGRVGLGCTPVEPPIDDRELAEAKALLLEAGAAECPEAAIVLAAEEGKKRDGRAAWELGRRALAAGEPALAVRWFHLSGRVGPKLDWTDEVVFGSALAASGSVEAAAAIHHVTTLRRGEGALGLDQARLAIDLAAAGRADRSAVDKVLRRTERLNRDDDFDVTLEARVIRALVALRHREVEGAVTLLRRVSREQVEEASPRVRQMWHLALAKAGLADGNDRMAARNLEAAWETPGAALDAPEAARLALRLWGPEDEEREKYVLLAIEQAASVLRPVLLKEFLEDAGPRGLRTLAATLGEMPSSLTSPIGKTADVEGAFRRLERWGAVALATLKDGQVVVFPRKAARKKALSAWLRRGLERLDRFGGGWVIDLPVPDGEEIDFVVGMPEFADLGPTVVLYRRSEEMHPEELLSATGTTRSWLARALDRGWISPAQVEACLEEWYSRRDEANRKVSAGNA